MKKHFMQWLVICAVAILCPLFTTACSCDDTAVTLTDAEVSSYLQNIYIENGDRFVFDMGIGRISFMTDTTENQNFMLYSESFLDWASNYTCYLNKEGDTYKEYSQLEWASKNVGTIYALSTSTNSDIQNGESYDSYFEPTEAMTDGTTYYYGPEDRFLEFTGTIFDGGTTYYEKSGDSYVATTDGTVNTSKTYYVNIPKCIESFKYCSFLKKNELTYFVKENNKYYQYTAYVKPNTEMECYGATKTEITKLDRDYNVEGSTGFINSLFSGMIGGEDSLSPLVTYLYGADKNLYSVTGEKGDDIRINITCNVVSSLALDNITQAFTTTDPVLPNILQKGTYEICLKNNGAFKSITISSDIDNEYKIFGDTNYSNAMTISADTAEFVNYIPTTCKEISNLNAANEITVSFDAPIAIESKTITALTDTTIDGIITSESEKMKDTDDYTFDGWFLDSTYLMALPTTFLFGKTDSNITLHAKCTSKHNVTLNSHTLTDTAEDEIINGDYTNYIYLGEYSEIRVEKPGYTFNGWYTTSTFDASTKVTDSDFTIITEDCNLYAKYTKLVRVTLDCGIDGKSAGVYLKYRGSEVNLPLNLYKDGFVFDGWYTTSTFDEGTKIAIIKGTVSDNDLTTTVKCNYIIPTTDTTLYAKFSRAIKITLHNFDRSTNGEMVTTYYISDTGTYSELQARIDGYNSANLNSYVNFNDADKYYIYIGLYTDSDYTTRFTSYPTSDINLYAKYIYNLTFTLHLDTASVDVSTLTNLMQGLTIGTGGGAANNFISYTINSDIYSDYKNDLAGLQTYLVNIFESVGIDITSDKVYTDTSKETEMKDNFSFNNLENDRTISLYANVTSTTPIEP